MTESSDIPTATPVSGAASPPPLPLAYAPVGMMPYEAAAGRARQVVIWMRVACVAQLLELWPTVLELIIHVKQAGGDEEWYPYGQVAAAGAAALVASVMVLVGWIMWWIWVHRAYRNLQPL